MTRAELKKKLAALDIAQKKARAKDVLGLE
jgi:hypothetical protein